MLKRALFLLSFCCLQSLAFGQTLEYQNFANISFTADNAIVYAFVQDRQGLLWLETDKGLYSYDGYFFQYHPYGATQQAPIFTCGVIYRKKYLYLGSFGGVYIYNIETDRFEKSVSGLPTDVRAVALQGNKLWIGTLTGLYLYNLKDGKITNYSATSHTGITHNAVYCLQISENNDLYVGTYNGLCVKYNHKDTFQKIELPVTTAKKSLLVNSLCEDVARKCIWVGTEGYLLQYHPDTKKVEHIAQFDGNSVKSLAIDKDNNLLLGTDNGLFVYNPEQNHITHVVHDTRNNNSLIDNAIWSIFVDKDKNAWFGTAYGISFSKNTKRYQLITIFQQTGVGDGNQIYCMFKDSRGNFWYGGSNGLIFVDAKTKRSIWYRMGDPRYPLSHNRVRCIYEDRDHDLWIATDGSISRYNYANHQFIHYNIIDKTGTRNANWAYSILEDNRGQLWIATYLGGLFIVDKHKLLANTSGPYVAERNLNINVFSTIESGNFVSQIVQDKQGNIWALTPDDGIARINSITGQASKMFFKSDRGTNIDLNSTCMLMDLSGYLWVGFDGGLIRIDPATNREMIIKYDALKQNNIRALAEEGEYIWISTIKGIFCLNKKTFAIQQINLPDKFFMSSFYDTQSHRMFLGGVDGYIVFSPNVCRHATGTSSLLLTDLLINGKSYDSNINRKGEAIRYLNRISLPYDQNNVTFQVSDLTYSKEENHKYEYYLNGVDREWHTIDPGTNRITYTNLSPGNYELTVRNVNTNPDNSQQDLVFILQIRYPWYNTIWARLFYLIVIVAVVYWLIKYYRDKHQIKIERIEREKSLELSNLKIDFFTNVSHELKTPLSLIIAPLSKMMLETRSTNLKKQLNSIYKNALRLNELVQQVVGFGHQDQVVDAALIKSQVEFVEFARGIFAVYEDLFQQKEIQGLFLSDIKQVYVEIDVVKMESVLNNLIFNAFKFTNQGGTITLAITQSSEENLQLIIADTGIGIPREDLPYVFERFYQSHKMVHSYEGSGIGLYLVKKYMDQHKGTIHIDSEENHGTTMTLTLPCSPIIKEFDREEQKKVVYATPTQAEPGKKEILIVEDNLEVSEFLMHSLSGEYAVHVAHNGKTGLDSALELHPDLIIADMMMPVLDGMEMCRQLRKHKEMSLIPIIMLTAKDDTLTEEQSLKAGVNAFVPKPFDLNILMLRVRQLITQNDKIEEKLRIEAMTTPKEIETTSYDEKLLANLTKIIEDNIDNPEMNVNFLSELSEISTKQIYRKIKKLTGFTPVDYIRSIRLEKAAMLLAQKKFSVTEVMYLVGFTNHSYFTKCFQNKFGQTPKQYTK
ncbi:two-component regulator propeller domain-containing protein [Microbacter margulisiae]|uniref:histidine kinase n=1 Tax=Microbacter margulisiae TaxID=1350067 RepID=A0A7W5H145_9PORP|nr:two-component regulator propeller domain-containing protein [Microbacter margulisiae]MBB3186259.1 signal transduction histidine kinase/ligand-binding sensor domain-containing protein/CheY-like chemotaxis protein/AraC-like DNA-binding protein [Microbacter margulisiae]